MKSKIFRWGGVVIAVTALVSSGPADAGTEPPSDDALEELRSEIPEGFPGEQDLTEAREEYLRLVSAYQQTTDVGDIGTGSTLTGLCGGYAYSFDKDGDLLDAVIDIGDDRPPVDIIDGGQAFTSNNPFKVDPRGLVQYYGFSPEEGDGPANHEWFIKTSGISLDKGGDPNTDLKNRNTGLVDLDNDLPVKFSAKIEVSGEMTSTNQPTCKGSGYVDVVGNGLTDPIGLAGLALLAGGFFGLLFNSRPAYTYKS